MALQYNTLGGGAAHSGTATPGRYEETALCSGCGFDATAEVIGRDGFVYSVCGSCEMRLQEQEPEEEEDWDDDELDCADCGTSLGPSRAPIRFLHLTKGAFWVCSDCWVNADHEDDYLVYCNCEDRIYWKPEGGLMSCDWCCRPVKHIQHCECPVPSTDKETPNHCVFCKGAVERKEDSQ